MTRRIRILDSAGTEVRADLPSDVPVEKLLPAILEQLSLPGVAPEGGPLDYCVYYQDRPLRSEETLDSAGVLDDATLTLVREAVFACFPPGTQITLADKRTTGIENIKIGDHVLSYDAERDRFEAGAVKSVLADRASKYLVINGTLRVTESQSALCGRRMASGP
ncbi:MAG TPA: EsaB/YukD family protein [Bryobacteraceae bacterium]|nr:EsaB/YukD family protein [Bryobacteraceae bacterium]